MATELRDLEADRRRLADLDCDLQTVGLSQDWQQEAVDIAIAALDEIERLKGLLVQPNRHGGFFAYCGREVLPYEAEADAWAAVRKAAMK